MYSFSIVIVFVFLYYYMLIDKRFGLCSISFFIQYTYPIKMMNSVHAWGTGVFRKLIFSIWKLMKGWRHSWWGKSVQILIALWACSLMTVRVESFGKSLTQHLWKKGQNQSRESVTFSFLGRLNEFEMPGRGNSQKHYITDIDIYMYIFMEREYF